MLKLVINPVSGWDEEKEEFVNIPGAILKLEHSLLSISKWESKWKKPFLSEGNKTREETVDYIRCMTLNTNVDPNVYYAINDHHIQQVQGYIEENQTATWFSDKPKGGRSREILTSELIYYQMVALEIPWEAQKWHFSRLMTLIHICAIKNQPDKKMSKKDILAQNAKLNAARRKKH